MTRGLMLAVSALTLAFPTAARAQAAPPAAAAEADIKATFRRYDAALRAGDPVAVAPSTWPCSPRCWRSRVSTVVAGTGATIARWWWW